jgi:hypothetical protein
MSSGVFLNSSSFIGAIQRFEGITTSSDMTKSSHASIKTKGVVETIWYLYSKGVDAFILKIKVGVMCDNEGRTS